MRASVVESLHAFFLARAPVVAFTLSLIAMAFSLFLVAFYIKDNDLLLNLHAQEDWNSFVNMLSSQKICFNTSDTNQSVSSLSATSTAQTEKSQNVVVLPAKVNDLHNLHDSLLRWHALGHAVSFFGHISSKGWRHSCQHYQSLSVDESNGNISIKLIIPFVKSLERVKELDVCVVLAGPPQHLPARTSLQNSQCGDFNMSVHKIGKIWSSDMFGELSHNKTTYVCSLGNKLDVSYDLKNDGPKIYLNNDDKLQIFSHLLQIGYLLLGLISVLLLVAVLQGRNLILTRQHTLLIEKETLS